VTTNHTTQTFIIGFFGGKLKISATVHYIHLEKMLVWAHHQRLSTPMKENQSMPCLKNALAIRSINGLYLTSIKGMVEQQQREVEKAIIGCGQYQIRPQLSYLAVAQEKKV